MKFVNEKVDAHLEKSTPTILVQLPAKYLAHLNLHLCEPFWKLLNPQNSLLQSQP